MLVVALYTRHFHPVLTGAAERFRRYAAGFHARGIRLEVHTLRHHLDLPKSECLEHDLQVYRHDIPLNTPLGRSDEPLAKACLEHILDRKSDDRPDLFLSLHATPPVSSLVKGLRKSGIKSIFVGTMVEPLGWDDPNGFSALRKARLRFWHYRSLSPFNAWITSTSVMAENLVQSAYCRRPATVIPNGVNTTRFAPAAGDDEKSRLREKFGLPRERIIALFVGNMIPRKGVDLLLHAWEQVVGRQSDVSLVLVGPLERPNSSSALEANSIANFQMELLKTINRLPPNSVHLLPEMQAIEEIYRCADLFVFPSRQEGMPNAVVEAMASGLPVIQTQYVGLPTSELGQPGSQFISCPLSATELGEAIGDLLSAPGERARLGMAARTWVLEQLSAETTLQSYADCLKHWFSKS